MPKQPLLAGELYAILHRLQGMLLITTFSLTLMLTGCSTEEKSKPTGVIPQGQLDALQKAKDLENEMKKRTEDLNKKMQKAEQ